MPADYDADADHGYDYDGATVGVDGDVVAGYAHANDGGHAGGGDFELEPPLLYLEYRLSNCDRTVADMTLHDLEYRLET